MYDSRRLPELVDVLTGFEDPKGEITEIEKDVGKCPMCQEKM